MTHPRLVGINHVALEVDEIDPALDFYGRLPAGESTAATGHGPRP
jgi:catechol 2,3-dioxygenase-like lactoylglutathione lyase family enzyme